MSTLGQALFLGLALVLPWPMRVQALAPREHVAELLSRRLESPDEISALAGELERLGSPAIPALFEALAADEPPGGPDAAHVEALLAALAALPRGPVLAYLTSLDRAALDDAGRRAALLVYGGIGTGEDLRAMVSIAAPLDPRTLIATRVRGAFREALGAVLARDASACRHVRGAFDVAHPSLRAQLIDGLRDVEPEAGLSVLSTLLGSEPELDLLALMAVGQLAPHSAEQIDPTLLQNVRGYLSKGDERLVQAAVIALGRLRDPRAVHDLIGLLDSPNENLRSSADRALMETAGRSFRGDPDRWRDWYAGEQAWWSEAEARLVTDLRSQHAAHVARALNEVAAHGLFRRELELLLVEELSAADPILQAMACSALGRLGSRAALDELRSLVDHRDLRVGAAAREACQRILGEPMRPEAGG